MSVKVEREPFESKNKTCFSYFIRANIHGKNVKIQVAPPNKDTDIGGYALLDVVFGDAMEADLIVTPFEMKGEDGKIIKGNKYTVRTVDENGEVYECPVKPARASDKGFMAMLSNL